MSWTVGLRDGTRVIVSDGGWNDEAKSYVPKVKKFGNGRKHSGPSGRQMKPARVRARMMAEAIRARRIIRRK